MKIIVKNLKQVEYNVEIESDKKTVKDLKNEIEKVHGFDSNLMKLLHNGAVLDDSKTLESYNIKDENVVIMMNCKPKQKPSIPQPNPTDNTSKTENKNNEEKKPDFTEKINSLVEMGYEKEKVEKALNVANGRVELAIEYLTSGNIPENPPTNVNVNLGNNNNVNNNSNLDPDLVKNASILKILCQNNPNKIFSLLNNIKSKSPTLFNKIKQHEEEFKNLLIAPITQEDITNFRNTQLAIRSGAGRRPQIQLTKEESDAVKRLKQLGNFSQAEVIQAYIACDKNEELTANFLFEQKLRDEDEAYQNSQNQNQGQGQGQGQ